MKKIEIKAVIFDVGGVLALGKYSLPKFKRKPLGKSFHEYMVRKLQVDMDFWFDSFATIHNEANEGKYTKHQAIAKIAKNLNVNPIKLESYFKKSYKACFVENKKLMRYALQLKKKGYRIAILSDQWPVAAELFIPKRYYQIFDPVIVSCDVNMRKPHPEIYKYTLKKLKLKPAETVFIDNRDYNLVPAQRLKMKTVLFEDTKQAIADLAKLGVHA